MKSLRFPWHPYLFGMFPILFLYAQNVDHVSWRHVVGPLLVTLVAIACLTLLLYLPIRNIRKAAMVSSVVTLWLFSWKRVTESVPQFQEAAPYVMVALGLIMIILLLITRKPLDKATVMANQVGLMLVILQLGLAAWAMAGQEKTELLRPAPVEISAVKGDQPNIYYIVPDGYGRADVLARLYDFDNSEFLSYLRNVGFYVADSSCSNYSQTQLSLTSSLNMEMIQDLVRIDPRSRDRKGFKQRIDDNRLMRFLREHGYTIVQLYTPFDLAMLNDADVVVRSWYDFTEFSESLIQTTPLDLVLTRFGRYRIARQRIVSTLDRLPELDDVKEPYFVLAHVLCPHPPFLWDGDGREVQPDRPFSMADGSHYFSRGGTPEEYVRGYRNQVRQFNRLLRQSIGRILSEHADHPPVIILQGDHGPGLGFNQIRLNQTDVHERFPILNACFLPGADTSALYPSITPVNTFRVVLNAYFGTSYPLLPDRSFYSPSFNFLHLQDVTDKLADPR